MKGLSGFKEEFRTWFGLPLGQDGQVFDFDARELILPIGELNFEQTRSELGVLIRFGRCNVPNDLNYLEDKTLLGHIVLAARVRREGGHTDFTEVSLKGRGVIKGMGVVGDGFYIQGSFDQSRVIGDGSVFGDLLEAFRGEVPEEGKEGEMEARWGLQRSLTILFRGVIPSRGIDFHS